MSCVCPPRLSHHRFLRILKSVLRRIISILRRLNFSAYSLDGGMIFSLQNVLRMPPSTFPPSAYANSQIRFETHYLHFETLPFLRVFARWRHDFFIAKCPAYAPLDFPTIGVCKFSNPF